MRWEVQPEDREVSKSLGLKDSLLGVQSDVPGPQAFYRERGTPSSQCPRKHTGGVRAVQPGTARWSVLFCFKSSTVTLLFFPAFGRFMWVLPESEVVHPQGSKGRRKEDPIFQSLLLDPWYIFSRCLAWASLSGCKRQWRGRERSQKIAVLQ